MGSLRPRRAPPRGTHRGHQVDQGAVGHGLRVRGGQVALDGVAAVVHLRWVGGRVEWGGPGRVGEGGISGSERSREAGHAKVRMH